METINCKHCDSPIAPCKPWGWHHLDGNQAVMCRVESLDLATPPDIVKEEK